MQSQKQQNDLCSFPRQTIQYQVYAPTSNAEEAEAELFYEDLQDLVELTPKKDILFIIGDWNAKVGLQNIPGVTCKFGLGVQNKAGQRLTEFSKFAGILRAALSQHHLIGFETAQLEFITSTSFVRSDAF